MPRILLVAHWDWVLEHFRLPIARALRDAGADVVLVSPPGPGVATFHREGWRWIPWDVRRATITPGDEFRALADLRAIYLQERPDAVHHYTIKPALYGTIAARLACVPTIVNVFSGLGFTFGEDARARRLRRLLLPVMRVAFARRGIWVFALNREDLTALRASRLAHPARSGLLPEGVDTDRFRPTDRSHDAPPVVLLACRLIEEKGVRDLVAAARSLHRRGIAVDVRIAGSSDEGNPSSIPESQLSAWQDEGVVQLLGARADVDALLRDADIAVLPTHYKEGLPWFLLEAAASGLPCVASDVPGCREIVQDGITGRLVPPHDPAALATAIAELAGDPELRQRLGGAGRRLVEQHHGEGHVQDEHLRIYQGLGLLPG